MTSGVYIWTCLPSGRQYVGSSFDIEGRKKGHLTDLRKAKHHSYRFQRAFDKHGEIAFEFRALLICEPTDLLMYEQRAIDALKPELNICKTAGSSAGSSAGIKRRKATLEALKKALSGRKLSEKHKLAISAGLSKPEAKSRLRKAHKFYFSDPAFKIRHAAATSMAQKGVPLSAKNAEGIKKALARPEVKKQMSLSGKAAWDRPGERARRGAAIGAAKKGIPLSDLHKEALKKAWERRKRRNSCLVSA